MLKVGNINSDLARMKHMALQIESGMELTHPFFVEGIPKEVDVTTLWMQNWAQTVTSAAQLLAGAVNRAVVGALKILWQPLCWVEIELEHFNRIPTGRPGPGGRSRTVDVRWSASRRCKPRW